MRKFDWRSLLRHEGGSVLMMILGCLLTVNPDIASGVVSAVLGWILIAMGVSVIVMGFVAKLGLGPIVSGALMLLTGSWFHRNPLMIASAFGVMMGILVLSQGFREARTSGRIKRFGGIWIISAVLSVAEILIGIRLILSPMFISRLVLRLCGIFMIVCGLGNITDFLRSRRYLNDSNIIDAE